MRRWLILVFGIVGWLAGGGTANARQALPPTPNPSIFNCGGCPQIDDRLRAIQDELATLRERLKNIRSNQQTLGSSIARTAREIMEHTSDLAAGKPGAADALGKARTRLQEAAAQLNRLNDAFRRTIREESVKELEAAKLRQQQGDCRRACPDAHTGRTNSTGSTTGTQTATTPAECHDCAKLAADLKVKQDRLNELQEDLTGALLEMATQGLEASGYLTEARNADPTAGTGVQPADFLDQEMREFDSWTTKLQGDISKQAAEVEAARQALEKCDETCAPPTTPISRTFSRPLLYAAGGGVAAAALLAVGDGDSPTVIASTPVTPPQPVTVTPTPQPQPQVRRPAALVNVSACVCVDNSAVLDGTLQLCQRLRQIRATGAGNSIALTGDAPLPAFQGTFNENTGVFELSATTVVGTTTSNVVIAGTVEMNGNFSNLRVSFGASGRQTLYTLMTAVAQ